MYLLDLSSLPRLGSVARRKIDRPSWQRAVGARRRALKRAAQRLSLAEGDSIPVGKT